jgi:hypothetical protein
VSSDLLDHPGHAVRNLKAYAKSCEPESKEGRE